MKNVEQRAYYSYAPIDDMAALNTPDRYGRKVAVRCKCERSARLFSERTFGAVRKRCVEARPVLKSRR